MKSEHPLHTQKSQAASYPENAVLHERQAQEHKVAGDIEKAFELYDRAGRIHKEHAEHRKSAICFSAAATCWNIHTGWQPLQKAASRNYEAARQAKNAKDYSYVERVRNGRNINRHYSHATFLNRIN